LAALAANRTPIETPALSVVLVVVAIHTCSVNGGDASSDENSIFAEER
jgi:hypothetical protein